LTFVKKSLAQGVWTMDRDAATACRQCSRNIFRTAGIAASAARPGLHAGRACGAAFFNDDRWHGDAR
jgi:hypothetical protein